MITNKNAAELAEVLLAAIDFLKSLGLAFLHFPVQWWISHLFRNRKCTLNGIV